MWAGSHKVKGEHKEVRWSCTHPQGERFETPTQNGGATTLKKRGRVAFFFQNGVARLKTLYLYLDFCLDSLLGDSSSFFFSTVFVASEIPPPSNFVCVAFEYSQAEEENVLGPLYHP